MTNIFIKFIALHLMLLAWISGALAQSCPATNRHIPWESACFSGQDAERFVRPEFVKNIFVNEAGVAIVEIDRPIELLAVDSQGKVKMPHIFQTGASDFPFAVRGLSRFLVTSTLADGSTASKCGYFDNISYKIAIPAIYDECLAFGEGTAQACNDCKRYCTESDCQSSILVGGNGVVLDSANKVVRRIEKKTLDTACNGHPPDKIILLARNQSYLQCPERATSPFQQLR